tara:strand:- start:529 stop:771 length:243 start_codon:yes stop_codon:yes gene_type:complete
MPRAYDEDAVSELSDAILAVQDILDYIESAGKAQMKRDMKTAQLYMRQLNGTFCRITMENSIGTNTGELDWNKYWSGSST